MKSEGEITVKIIEKQISDTTNLNSTAIKLPTTIEVLKDLICELVLFEIKRHEAYNNFTINSEEELRAGIKLGKVGGSVDKHYYKSVNKQKAIETALIAFEHQDYYVFIDQHEVTKLTSKVNLVTGSEIILINNVRFKGRY